MINAFDPQWLAQLDACAQAQTKPSYLLMDGVFLEDALSFIRKWPLPVEPQNALFCERAHRDDAVFAASPWLLPYLPGSAETHELLAQCDALPGVICIQSDDAPPGLLSRLKRWTVVSCGDMQFNFRFTDTRRLPAIHRALSQSQRASLFGARDQWSFMNRQGKWEALQALDVVPGHGLLPSTTAPWDELKAPELNDEQFAALLKDSEPDEVIAAIWQDLPEGCATRAASLPAEVHQHAVQALKQADRLGVTSTPDRMAVCRWVLQQSTGDRLVRLQSADLLNPDVPVEDALRPFEAVDPMPSSRYA
jgi:Domain of unknown function (DUF4123)